MRIRPKALALLALLALSDGEVPRHTLARLLFNETEDPLAALRWHLSYLRSVCLSLTDIGLNSTRTGVALDIGTDVAAFRDGCARLNNLADAQNAVEVLNLYRGDLLQGLCVRASPEFDTWLYVEQESLRRLFGQTTTAFARQVLGSERASESLDPLARLVSLDPYREEAHVLLIETLEQVADHEHARAAYDRYQRIVRQDLAAEPRPSLAWRFEDVRAEGYPLPREDVVPLQEVTLHIVEWGGDGPVVLGIHGSGMLAHSLAGIAEQIAPPFRFISIDLRGHGLSDKPPSGYDLQSHVDDILQLIEALHLHRPVLLGHSAGGTIATFVANRAEVSGLVLLEAMIGERAFVENAAAAIAPWAEMMQQRFGGFEEYIRAWQRPQWAERSEQLADRWVRHALAPLPDGSYRPRIRRGALEAEWASIMTANSLEELSRVTCPLLNVWTLQPFIDGRPYFSEAIIADQLSGAPHSETFIAARSSHGSMVRDPEQDMVEAIRDFIDRCRDRGQARLA